MEEGIKGRTTTEVRSGGGGVAHSLSFAGRDTEVKDAVGTPAEEKAAGNTSFAVKDFAAAEKHYSKAIEQLEAQSADPAAAEVRATHASATARPQQTGARCCAGVHLHNSRGLCCIARRRCSRCAGSTVPRAT
jgi:hypothetical protein